MASNFSAVLAAIEFYPLKALENMKIRSELYSLDFRAFLRAMNGTDLPPVNIYGYSGEPPREWVGVYSYPRDIKIVMELIEHIRGSREEITNSLAEQSYDLPPDAGLVPLYGHRYLVCAHPNSSVVLSIVANDTDAIVYGKSLADYLEREFLNAKA